jgi:hypothetical protein
MLRLSSCAEVTRTITHLFEGTLRVLLAAPVPWLRSSAGAALGEEGLAVLRTEEKMSGAGVRWGKILGTSNTKSMHPTRCSSDWHHDQICWTENQSELTTPNSMDMLLLATLVATCK